MKQTTKKQIFKIGSLAVAILLFVGSSPNSSSSGQARMKADYVEACSCPLFCPCYFNKHAEHPSCEFNMAVHVREGQAGATNLAGAKYWLTGDLGDEWGTAKKGKWVVVSFDPSTSQPQRDAARGYGTQADRGTNSGAFSNYSQGGSARTNSARGQQSLNNNRASSAPQRSERTRPEQAHRGGGRRR